MFSHQFSLEIHVTHACDVFRVTGVISVIGGWFITAGVSFLFAAVVALAMYYGGISANIVFIFVVIIMLVRSNRKYRKKVDAENRDKDFFQMMMRTRDPELVWDMLQKQDATAIIARFWLMLTVLKMNCLFCVRSRLIVCKTLVAIPLQLITLPSRGE